MISPKTAGSLMYLTGALSVSAQFSLPHLWKGQVYDTSNSEFTPNDVRSMVGNTITIYNDSVSIFHVCGYSLGKDLQGNPSMVLSCFTKGLITPNHFCHMECKLSVDDNGYEYIYWDLTNGLFR
jgi:hypothetical protein